jgi:hypothetical protein
MARIKISSEVPNGKTEDVIMYSLVRAAHRHGIEVWSNGGIMIRRGKREKLGRGGINLP